MLTDTHVHFDLMAAGGADLPASLQRAAAAGVTQILAVGGTPTANHLALELARAYPGRINAAAALGRDQPWDPGTLRELQDLLHKPEFVAIGETGLDFHYGRRDNPVPRRQFQAMLQLAAGMGLPVLVHSREADAEILELLSDHARNWQGPADAIGIMHCFTGNADYAQKLLALGFCISFSGIVTFKNSQSLREAAATVPDDRLLLETDAPFLAPEPCRGRSNEPARLRPIAECLARLRGATLEELAHYTSANAARVLRRH
ncbi:MAG: TatD family hydrolase [Kiritimatiellia bacterium]|nr:TatD family hydrolase [Lentisphaerota bacterium]